MEVDYISVRFEDNDSKRWDGKEVEVPQKMVVRLGEWTVEWLERAQVHWPGKGGNPEGKMELCGATTSNLRPGSRRQDSSDRGSDDIETSLPQKI